MIKRHQNDGTIISLGGKLPTMNLANGAKVGYAKFGQKVTHWEAPQGGDDCRPDDVDLPVQPRRVGNNLFRQRVAIARRAIFNDVGNIDLLARQINRGQELVKEPAGRATERPAGFGFIFPGRLAHQHNLGLMTPLANHRQVALFLPISVKWQDGEIKHFFFNCSQLLGFGG